MTIRNALLAVVAVILLSVGAKAQELRIPIRLDKPAGVAAQSWPVTFGVPFAQGQCRDAATLTVVDDAGRPAPCQIVKTGGWTDGSTRWVLVDMTADFSKRYTMTTGARAAGGTKIRIAESEGGRLSVATGAAVYEFGKSGGCFERITLAEDAKGQAAAGDALVKDAGRAFYVIDSKGRRATLAMGRMSVELAGDLRTVVRVEGDYLTDAGERAAAAIIYYHFYAGLPWARVSHKLIVTGDTNALWFREIGLSLPVATQGKTTAAFNNHRDKLTSIAAFALEPGQEVVMTQEEFPHFASEKSRYAVTRHDGGKAEELGSGAACGDWADLSDARWGIAAQVPAFAETFPKAMRLSDRTLTVKLWAAEGGKELDFRTENLMKNYFGNDWIPADHSVAKASNNAKGIARTHEIWLYPHAGALTEAVAARFGATRREIYAMADPAWIAASEVMGPWLPRDVQRFPEAENVIEDYFRRTVLAGQQVFPPNGFLYYGMYPWACQPWEIKNGRWYPTIHRLSRCLEYNLKRHVWILFARSGDRTYFDYARRYTRLQHDLLWSNCDWDEKLPKGRTYQNNPFESPILWGGRAAYLAFASSEDVIQFVYDYFLTGDYHSRDMTRNWKAAMEAGTRYDVEEGLKVAWPPVAFLRILGSAYELDRDPKLYDYGHRLLQAMCDEKNVVGINVEVKENFGKAGELFSAFYYYYVSTGDPLAKMVLCKLADFDYRNGRLNFMSRSSAEAYAYAYAWRETKDPRYARYLAEHVRDEGRNALTLAKIGVKLEEIDQKFNKEWGEATITGSGPVFVGLPVSMRVVADAGMPRAPRPLAVKPFPTQRTYILLKKETPAAAMLDVYVNNVGERAVQPRLLDLMGQPTALEVVERSEHRETKPPGTPHYDGGMYSPYYLMFESHLFFRLRIPAGVAPGVYHLDCGEQVRVKVLESDIEKVIQVAPDGVVLLAGQRYYFPVPVGTPAVEFFSHRPVRFFAPDGTEVAAAPEAAPDGTRTLKTGDRAGVWAVETGRDDLLRYPGAVDTFVRLRNIPFVLAMDDAERLFDLDAKAFPSSEPEGIRALSDPKQPFQAGRFGQGLYLTNQFVDLSIPKDLPAVPHARGTVEFWWRPHWSAGDFDMARSTQRQFYFNLDPIGLTWITDCPNSGRTPYYNDAWMDFHLFANPEDRKAAASKSRADRPKLPLPTGYRALFYPTAGRWYHIALTWDIDGKNSEMDVYINGRRKGYADYRDGLARTVPPENLKPFGDRLRIGSGHFTKGCASGEDIDELRISTVVRYKDDFAPPEAPFAPDKDTWLLLHLDGNVEGTLAGKPVTGKLTGPLGNAASRLF